MLGRLITAGADPNASLTRSGDTALMMAARTGKPDAVRVLLDRGAKVNAQETWGGTTALMWAVSEKHPEVAKLLIERGADVNARSYYVPSASGRGFRRNHAGRAEARRQLRRVRERLADAVDVRGSRKRPGVGAAAGEGRRRTSTRSPATARTRLSLAFFDGSYDVAEFLIDSHANVNQADAQRFTPLFWAVDRRNMETAPNFPVDGDARSAAADQEAAGCRRQSERARSTPPPGRACGKDRRASSTRPR